MLMPIYAAHLGPSLRLTQKVNRCAVAAQEYAHQNVGKSPKMSFILDICFSMRSCGLAGVGQLE
jgi:hypothetical protein